MPYVKRFKDANYFRKHLIERIEELERKVSEDQAELERLRKAISNMDKAKESL